MLVTEMFLIALHFALIFFHRAVVDQEMFQAVCAVDMKKIGYFFQARRVLVRCHVM
jgi:hypothetical protein